jgi:hypothetical protein
MSRDAAELPPPGQLGALSEQVRASVAPPPELELANPLACVLDAAPAPERGPAADRSSLADLGV